MKLEDIEVHAKAIDYKFELVHEMVTGVLSNVFLGLIIRGEPGIGKSYAVDSILKTRTDKVPVWYKGYLTPLQAFYAFGDNKDPENVVVFDDCDSVFQDNTSLNILKAALDPQTNRRVSWNSSYRNLKYESYHFKGSIIILTNASFYSSHYKALLDRIHVLDLQITKEEKIAKIFQLAERTEDIDTSAALEVADWLVGNYDRIKGVSLRTFIKTVELAKFSDKWKDLAIATIFQTWKLKVALKLK